jgi:hypothetical protein
LLCRNCRFISSLIILIISGCFVMLCLWCFAGSYLFRCSFLLSFPLPSRPVLTRWLTWLWEGVKINDRPPLESKRSVLSRSAAATGITWPTSNAGQYAKIYLPPQLAASAIQAIFYMVASF